LLKSTRNLPELLIPANPQVEKKEIESLQKNAAVRINIAQENNVSIVKQ